MPISTPILSLQKPTVGGDFGAWGGFLDSNFDILDALGALTVISPSASQSLVVATSLTVALASGTITLTLPTAVGNKGRSFLIKNIGVGTITMATVAAQTIEGVSTYLLVNQFQYVQVVSDGANWLVIGRT